MYMRRWFHQPGPTRILASIPRRTDVAYAPPRMRYSFLDDDEDQLKPLQIMARRVALAEDIWQLLQKGLKDQDKPRSYRIDELANKSGYQLSDPSWDLLGLLVDAWKLESEYKLDGRFGPGFSDLRHFMLKTWFILLSHSKFTDANANLNYSPSLLAQFKPSAMGGPAGDVVACMDIIFQPFKDLHLSNPQRTDHIANSSKLLSLLADLSTAGMIDKAAFQTIFCEAMYQLRVANLQEFVVVSEEQISLALD